MLGCNTVCPKCRHEFTCCPASGRSASHRRSLHALTGGGLVVDHTSPTTSLPPAPAFMEKPRGCCRSPQTSPSMPLTFVLPCPTATSIPALPAAGPETELQRLSDSVRLLRTSGWYHEGLSWQQSQTLLKNTAPGTFLIRDSSDQRFLYALSVQTEQGPTSVRLHYVHGKFRLDSEPYLAQLMPLFDTVIDLIVHYVRCSAQRAATAAGQVWVDSNGCMFSRILLRRPLLRADRVPTLQHLARLSVHRALESSSRPRLPLLPPPHTQLQLPAPLIRYLAEYPYSL